MNAKSGEESKRSQKRERSGTSKALKLKMENCSESAEGAEILRMRDTRQDASTVISLKILRENGGIQRRTAAGEGRKPWNVLA
jgi:hypothetical protein